VKELDLTITAHPGSHTVSLPVSLTSIGEYAFYGCSSLAAVSLPDSLTSLGEHTFDGCSSLTAVTLPASLTSIGGKKLGPT